jgi:uracil-DNA glycosylase
MMPEGPEVRVWTDELQNAAGQQKVVAWHALSGRYADRPNQERVLPTGWLEFQSQLQSPLISEIGCKGKFMYMILTSNSTNEDYQPSIWFTFGLTGRFVNEETHERYHERWLATAPEERYAAFAELLDDDDEYGQDQNRVLSAAPARWYLETEHAITQQRRKIYYYDSRNFGTIRFSLSRKELDEKLASLLGPDFLGDYHQKPLQPLTWDEFNRIALKGTGRQNICRFLMDQKKIAGIGNYILAEALYRARVDPYATVGEVMRDYPDRFVQLYEALVEVGTSSYQSQSSLLPSFALQCYGQEICPRGDVVRRDLNGPHARTIWYTDAQLFMPLSTRFPQGRKRGASARHDKSVKSDDTEEAVSRDDEEDLNDEPDRDESNDTTVVKRRRVYNTRSNDSRQETIVAEVSTEELPSNVKKASRVYKTPRKSGDNQQETAPATDDVDESVKSTGAKAIGRRVYKTRSNLSEDKSVGNVKLLGPVDALLSHLDEKWRLVLADATGPKTSFSELAKFVMDEVNGDGAAIYPPLSKVFAALNLCAPEDVKVVIVGQDPYHGPGQANGLAFSVEKGVPLPPSLKNIFKEAADDMGIRTPKHGNLECWAKQGVLLLNTVLTVRRGEANTHAKHGWEEFTDAVIDSIAKRQGKSHVVFLLWGIPAAIKAQIILQNNDSEPGRNSVIRSSHPSPLGASKTKTPFLGSRCFSRTNDVLIKAGQKPIDWNVD